MSCGMQSARCWWSGTEGCSVIASAAKQSRVFPRRQSGLLRCARNDDVEALCAYHSGLRDLALPDGQNTQIIGQSASPKIFYFTEIRKRRMCRLTPAQGRGAHRDRHERGPDGGGRKPHRREGLRGAGNRERGHRAHDRCGSRTAKSCGPDARSLCVKSCGDVAARPARASAIRKATGAIVHRSPGRSRHKP